VVDRTPLGCVRRFRLRARFGGFFLGAIGHPDVKPGILEVGILLKTRFALDQYINLRPAKLYPNVETPLKDKGPEHVDLVVVRENTGGIYTGIGGVTQKGTPLEVATQVMQYSRPVVGSRGEPCGQAAV
jgi:3-isopropylmalate dehydrogenase